MKYIEKDFSSDAVVKFCAELKENRLDKESLSDPSVHPTLTGPKVYSQVCSFRYFNALKEQMYKDQGGICCYCGQKLTTSSYFSPYIVEHVIPKSECRQLAGEYENLLLSCRSDLKEEGQQELNKKNKEGWHCDKRKENHRLTYNPLQRECGNHFRYLESGDIDGNDELAKKDIKTLGLDCKYLVKRRKMAIDTILHDEDGNLLADEVLEQYLQVIMNRKPDNTFREFCFVIAGALNNFLHNR